MRIDAIIVKRFSHNNRTCCQVITTSASLKSEGQILSQVVLYTATKKGID